MNTQTPTRVVILGGGYAGMLAAARIARNPRTSITLIDQKPFFVQRIRLHELLAGQAVARIDYRKSLSRRGIVFQQARVVGINAEHQELQLITPDAAEQRLGYDLLLITLGSTTHASASGVAEHALRLDDPQVVEQAKLRELAARGGRVLVVGSGATAVETASELAEQLPGLHVAMVARGRIGEEYIPNATHYLRSQLAHMGVELLDDTPVTALEADRAVLADGRDLVYDRCIWTAGFTAASLVREAGFAVDMQGRALVTPTLQLPNHPNIFVAGDSAAVGDSEQRIRMGCVSALPMGAHASENMLRLIAGKPLEAFDYGFVLRCLSVGRKQGLVQFVDHNDAPVNRVITHRSAAIVKELICRMTFESIRGEMRTGMPLYAWPGGGHWFTQPTQSLQQTW